MNSVPVEHVFADADAQAQGLADAVGTRLRAAIAARGGAWLAVPGGDTPQEFLRALAQQTLDWPRVNLALTDERLVPVNAARSNARLLRESLLDRVPARFLPLVDGQSGKTEVPAAATGLPKTFDVVVLGMGADGHCASLFADADNIAAALGADGGTRVMRLSSPSVPEARVTLTLSALVATRALFVLIRGVEKRRTLESALRGAEPFAQAPIRAVMEHAPVVPQVYWSP
ncbi:MAG: 6-phosphogluconolactonase [Proteobacteria bacterium]|nr:6-phosphogluconolactonase [Pseudomonadota bacterium]